MRYLVKIAALTVLVTAVFSNIAIAESPRAAADKIEFDKRLTRAISIANERLEQSDPPRYKLIRAVAELSVVRGASGEAGIQIPILQHGADVTGKYSKIKTVTEKETYVPLSEIKIGEEDDFGLISYVEKLQKDYHEFYKNAGVVKTPVEHTEEFVVEYIGEGKLSFFSVISLGGSGSAQNIQRVTFTFCIQNESGECLEPKNTNQ